MKRYTLIFLASAVLVGVTGRSLHAENIRDPKTHTPTPGTMERRAILDGLRYWVRNRLHLNVRFVVRHLKVRNGWAWVETDPRSPDGKAHYEPIRALLKKGRGCWAVVTVASDECTSADDPERACAREELRLIRALSSYPLFVPSEIFR